MNRANSWVIETNGSSSFFIRESLQMQATTSCPAEKIYPSNNRRFRPSNGRLEKLSVGDLTGVFVFTQLI
jgi:hypothetical protein